MITQQFKDRLTMLLNQRAAEDKLFAQELKKEKKSIDECCKYVMGEVTKWFNKNKGSALGMDDSEVLAMAVHYYDEDDIQVKKASAKVVAVGTDDKPATATNNSKPAPVEYKPTEEEVEAARKKAIAKLEKEIYNNPSQRDKTAATKAARARMEKDAIAAIKKANSGLKKVTPVEGQYELFK